jgi:hypothetical protein
MTVWDNAKKDFLQVQLASAEAYLGQLEGYFDPVAGLPKRLETAYEKTLNEVALLTSWLEEFSEAA